MAATMAVKLGGQEPVRSAAIQRAQMDDNYESNLRSCNPEAIKQQQQQQDRLYAEQPQSQLTFTAPTRRLPIRAASLRSARFSSQSSSSNSLTNLGTAVDTSQQRRATLGQTQKQRQQQQTWPTGLISAPSSVRTTLSSKAIPITRNGVHQSIRLHRNTLLAERKQATNSQQQVNCSPTLQASKASPRRVSDDSLRFNNSSDSDRTENSTSSAKLGASRIGRVACTLATSSSSSSSSPSPSRPPSASPATTNSRVRQATLYARRQYLIRPLATSQVAANKARTGTLQPQANHAGSSPLRLSASACNAAPGAAQSPRSTGARSSLPSSSSLSSSSPLATASKSTTALNIIHRATRNSSVARNEQQFNMKPLKSSSKFTLTSSTSSLSRTVVKRVKPSEPNQQQVDTNTSFENEKRAAQLAGSLPLSTYRDSHGSGSAAGRHFLSARRGLSSSTLAASNRKPATRANRSAASNGAGNVNKPATINPTNIVFKNTIQTDKFGEEENVSPPDTSAKNNCLAPFINNLQTTLAGERAQPATTAESFTEAPLLSSSFPVERTNSLDSNLEAIDEHMVLGSPLVTPPPSELDADETAHNNNDSATTDVDETKIDATMPDILIESSKPMAAPKLSIPIRTEPITDYYDLEARPFARGKFAQVRRCIHKASQKCFAAKCIKKRRRLVDIRHEILLEIEALKLSYYTNHIVKLYEVYETPTEMILVLEMANGGELQRVLDDEEAIDERLVKRMVKQILEGLTQLHDNDIAHLDIKPQNLLLTEGFPNGEVKLCDFGISRRITKDCEIREICGTPDYVAPEILRYDPISLATDLWSLGVLTYVLLTGYSPFGSENKQQTFCNITQAALDFPSEIFDKISKEAIDFMQKLMVREPSKRLTSRQARNHSWLN